VGLEVVRLAVIVALTLFAAGLAAETCGDVIALGYHDLRSGVGELDAR
jgi:hypothetical protein